MNFNKLNKLNVVRVIWLSVNVMKDPNSISFVGISKYRT